MKENIHARFSLYFIALVDYLKRNLEDILADANDIVTFSSPIPQAEKSQKSNVL